MPALKPTEFAALITWLGRVPVGNGLASTPCDRLSLDFDGPKGELHAGRTRRSCARVTAQHPKGTEIANTRQLSLLSAEELAAIAGAMGLETLAPDLVGASVVVTGIPDFSHIPPSSRLQGPDGTTLVVDMENRPCTLPDKVIEAAPAGAGHGAAFRTAARGRRGVTAWVERPGTLRLGGSLRLHVPDQPAWAPQTSPAR